MMRRSPQVAGVLLLAVLLASGPLLPQARADTPLTPLSLRVGYYQVTSSPPAGDRLADYLQLSHHQLAQGGYIELEIMFCPDSGTATVAGAVQAGEEVQEFTGEGEFARYPQSNLFTGEFVAELNAGQEFNLYVDYLPLSDESQVTIVFEEHTPQAASVIFGLAQSNISGVHYQLAERERAAVELPPAFWLDGTALELSPQPLNVDNVILVPARQLLQALGAAVQWNAADSSVLASKEGVEVVFSVGSRQFTLNGETKQFATAPQLISGTTMAPLMPLAEMFGATIVSRSDGSFAILRAESIAAITGLFRVIFIDAGNMIFINDTSQPMDLSNWAITAMPLMPLGYDTFRFPTGFNLQPGEHVQVQTGSGAWGDNKSLLKWPSRLESTELPSFGGALQAAPVQIMIGNLMVGSEVLSILNRSGDEMLLGNWQFLSAQAKPALSFPHGFILPQGGSLMVSGRPGAATNPNELRWPNISSIEEQYAREQQDKEAYQKELRAAQQELYAEVASMLELDETAYCFYAVPVDRVALSNGELPPFVGQRALATAFELVVLRAIEKDLVAGGKAPVLWIAQDGSDAYVAAIKENGEVIAYHALRQADEYGIVTWSVSQVLGG